MTRPKPTTDLTPIPWWLWLVLAATAAAMLATCGCESPGKALAEWTETVTRHRQDGTPDTTTTHRAYSESTQPTRGTSPAAASAGPTGSVSDSGNQQEQTAAMVAAGKAWISYVVGGSVMLAGVGLLIARKWMPLIPTSAGTTTMLAGGAIIVVATVSVSIPWWAWMIAAVAAAMIVVPGMIANKKALKPKEQT